MAPPKKTERAELGLKIATLRTRRGWSRLEMLRRLYDELEAQGDQNFDARSEAWLARVERGAVVKLNRKILEAIMKALECAPAERVDLLLAADRSIFPRDDNQQDSATILLARATFTLVNDEAVQTFITNILSRNNLEAATFTDRELLLVLGEVINVALDAQKRDAPKLKEQEPAASSVQECTSKRVKARRY